jgi:uncharacterized protein YndB with AHSA1/START domain
MEVSAWWDPTGRPLAVCEIDLRPNGSFRWINQGDTGAQFPFSGTYSEIIPPKRLVFKVQTSPEVPPMSARSFLPKVAAERS